ncbi:MAG: hypothetical protein PVJ02_14975 [Gemmatimonadota bacterium]|jgi:hypothetical protein
MEQGWDTLIGMSIAYVASFIGLGLAWYGWTRRHDDTRGGGASASEHDGEARP